MEICSNTQTEVQNISRKGYLSSNFCGGAGWAIGKEMLNWLLLFRFPTWGATNLICLVLVLPTVQRTQKARGLETMLRIFSRSEMFSPAVWPKLLEVEKTASKSIIHNVKPAEVLKQSLQPKPRKNRTVEQWLAKFCATTVTDNSVGKSMGNWSAALTQLQETKQTGFLGKECREKSASS